MNNNKKHINHITPYHITSPHTRGIPVNNPTNWFILNMTYKILQIFVVNCSYYCCCYCYHRVVALWVGHHCYCHSLLYHLFFYSYSFGLHSPPFDDCDYLALVLVLNLALSLCPRWIEWLEWLLWCVDSTCLIIMIIMTIIMTMTMMWWNASDIKQSRCVTWSMRYKVNDMMWQKTRTRQDTKHVDRHVEREGERS